MASVFVCLFVFWWFVCFPQVWYFQGFFPTRVRPGSFPWLNELNIEYRVTSLSGSCDQRCGPWCGILVDHLASIFQGCPPRSVVVRDSDALHKLLAHSIVHRPAAVVCPT